MNLNLTGTIICQNEELTILDCIDNIYSLCGEILILDGGSVDDTVSVIENYKNNYDKDNKISLYQNKFNGHFGDQKNLLTKLSKTVWVLNIDADELFSDNLKDFIIESLTECKETKNYQDFSAIRIPRRNLINSKDTGVFPDYQIRVFRSFCRFVYPVHEELCGYKDYITAPDDAYILHDKTDLRQKSQDKRYESLIAKFEYLMPKYPLD